MIYVVYGTVKELMDDYIKKVIVDKKIESVNKFSLDEVTLDDALEDAMYIDMFGGLKAVVVNDCSFLTGKLSVDTTLLEKYVSSPNESSVLFLVVNNEKLDVRKKIVKLLRSECELVCFNELKGVNLENKIKDDFEGFKLFDDALYELISRTNGEYRIIKGEIEKLKLYKSDMVIEKKDVVEVVSKSLEDNIFEIANLVVSGNRKELMVNYNDLVSLGEDPIKIMVILANQFRLFYDCKAYSSRGFRESDIAKKLGIHPFRVKLALQNSYSYSSESLFDVLEKLSDLDYEIKSGKIDKFIGMELLLLSL